MAEQVKNVVDRMRSAVWRELDAKDPDLDYFSKDALIQIRQEMLSLHGEMIGSLYKDVLSTKIGKLNAAISAKFGKGAEEE